MRRRSTRSRRTAASTSPSQETSIVSASDPATAAAPRTKTLATITVIVAFLVGVLVGAVGLWGWVLHRHGGRVPLIMALREQRILHRLDRELALAPQQHTDVARSVHASDGPTERDLGRL